MDDKSRMRQLVDRLNETARAYYVLDNPVISDKEWDALYDELAALERETGVTPPDSPTHRVGGEPLASFAQHRHEARLWSLDKAQSVGALREWAARAEKLGIPVAVFAGKVSLSPAECPPGMRVYGINPPGGTLAEQMAHAYENLREAVYRTIKEESVCRRY